MFLAATAVAMLSSCSNDEVISAPAPSAIGFENYVARTSRATDATLEYLKSMYVYGYIGDATPIKIFDGQLVSKGTTTSDWTYTPLQYWTAGKSYFFTALSSPIETEGNSHFSYEWAGTLPVDPANFYGSGTISFNNGETGAQGNEDVVYAYATKTTPDPLTASPGLVQFVFKHALSRVKFTFTNAMGSNAYSIKVYNLTINNAVQQANLVLGTENPEWSGHAGSASLTLRPSYFNPLNQTVINGGQVTSGTKFIIPGTAALKISFAVDLIVNGSTLETYNHVDVLLPETTFQNGHSYNFVAVINPANIDPENEMFPIEFTVQSVNDWIEDGNVDVELPENNN